METLTKELHLWVLWLLFFSFSVAASYTDYANRDNPSITYTYTRFADIEKHCGFILPSASELEPDDNRGERIKRELFFMNGDWDQDSGGAPLLPFNDHDMGNTFGNGPPLKFVSFWVMDVDRVRRAKNAVSVSGILDIGISRSSSFSYKPYDWSPKYNHQGVSSLTVLFEGIYTESEENGGERLMCLLGNATMPTSQFDDSMVSMNENGYSYYNQNLHLVPDDQIMLVLRYPKTFTLTSRGISGEMKSLNQKWNFTYFDKVHISSQLGSDLKYQFGSEELLSKACSPYPYQDNLVDEEVEMFKGEEFCEMLLDFAQNQIFDFVPSRKDGGANDQHHKLGPFVLGGRKTEATDGDLDNFRLMVQDLRCEPGNNLTEIRTARVSSVFRLIHSSENIYRAMKRTGLSSTTLAAEGRWRSSDGQLCMVSCRGLVGAPSDSCNSRICLYLPRTFSIKQRSMMFGTISSINKNNLNCSLIFEKLTHPKHISEKYKSKWHLLKNLNYSYKYTKIMQASEFQKRSKPSRLVNILRKSFLWCPSLKGTDMASLSLLSDVLSPHLFVIPHTMPNPRTPRSYVDVEVLSLASLFGRYRRQLQEEKLEVEKPFHLNAEGLKVSGNLSISGGNFYNVSMFFEGLYDPVVGEMYLIGCRDVRSSQKLVYNGTNLEGGMDCLIEVKIKYPPSNLQWLLNPKIKIFINSKRSTEDPLYLSPVSLNTSVVNYSKQLVYVIYRKGFEGVLRILMLTMAIICTRSQSVYTKNEGHPTAYISLVMLGVHTFAYSIPLITGNEVLLKWKEFKPYRTEKYDFEKLQLFQVLDSATNILLLAALLLNVKLFQNVCESRGRQFGDCHILKAKIPSDKIVFPITLAIHISGFFLFHVIHELYTSQIMVQLGNYYPRGNMKLLKWLGELEGYTGLIQDLFLLPQIAGNCLWYVQGKPLRKSYYMGFTLLRFLLHGYEYARDPVPSPELEDNELQHLDIGSYTKIGNVIMGAIVLILAVIVYIQQKCNYQADSQKVKPEVKELATKSDLYERLFSE